MTSATTAPARSRGRHRCREAESAILTATRELLASVPLRDITADAIARRAGVSKATIYKWWPSKSFVALDAFLAGMRSVVLLPNTGSARQDFTQQLKSVIRYYQSSHGRTFCQFIAEGQSNPEFRAQFLDRFLNHRRDEVRIMWQRGVARGDIDPFLDSEVVLDLVYGPTIFRLLTGHSPLNDEEAEKMVAAVFDGVAKRGQS